MEYPTDQLLDIIQKNSGYTDLAVSVAEAELKRRRVPAEEINEHKAIQAAIDQKVLENYLIDMSVGEKVLFFLVMWIPRVSRYFSPDYIEDGYKLKSQQGSYYAVFGFIAFIGTIVASYYSLGWFSFPIMFILAYSLDVSYNRQRQMSYLQKKIEEGRDPMDEFS
ncbi:MAG TPA: hypothetical protein VG367_05750 [Mucilaginibacter sp.]|nr:hypothetical protein [Mucilaginibacter sp.]